MNKPVKGPGPIPGMVTVWSDVHIEQSEEDSISSSICCNSPALLQLKNRLWYVWSQWRIRNKCKSPRSQEIDQRKLGLDYESKTAQIVGMSRLGKAPKIFRMED